MINYIIIVVFILSIAITAGGILISLHLRSTYKVDFLSTLMFFEVFWFTFGFYAIWGQVVIISIMKDLITSDLLIKIINITIILGVPFISFAWLMLIKMTREISKIETGIRFTALFLFFNFLIIPVVAYLITVKPGTNIYKVLKTGFIILNSVYFISASFFLFFNKKREKQQLVTQDRKNILIGLLFLLLSINLILIFYKSNIYLALSFIVLYYLTGVFIPVYFRYFTDLSVLLLTVEENKSFEKFCEKFEISKREKEIIHEICEGLTNQQIADKLYISLQTVKDHTHRIYTKTECSSRVQLIKLVNEDT